MSISGKHRRFLRMYAQFGFDHAGIKIVPNASWASPTRLRHKKDVDVQTGNELKHGSYKCKIPVIFALPPKNLNIPPSLKKFKTKKSGKKQRNDGQKTKRHITLQLQLSPRFWGCEDFGKNTDFPMILWILELLSSAPLFNRKIHENTIIFGSWVSPDIIGLFKKMAPRV